MSFGLLQLTVNRSAKVSRVQVCKRKKEHLQYKRSNYSYNTAKTTLACNTENKLRWFSQLSMPERSPVHHKTHHTGIRLCILLLPSHTCISFHSLSYSHISAALDNTALLLAVASIHYQHQQSNPTCWVMARSALHTLTGPNNNHFGMLLSWCAVIMQQK